MFILSPKLSETSIPMCWLPQRSHIHTYPPFESMIFRPSPGLAGAEPMKLREGKFIAEAGQNLRVRWVLFFLVSFLLLLWLWLLWLLWLWLLLLLLLLLPVLVGVIVGVVVIVVVVVVLVCCGRFLAASKLGFRLGFCETSTIGTIPVKTRLKSFQILDLQIGVSEKNVWSQN